MQSVDYSKNLKFDFSAGLVVFLIAVPLCLGIALASGAPLFSGLISGIIGGIVVGYVSASHTSVSGPAAGLAAVVFLALQDLGSFEVFLMAVFLAGLLQIALGYLRAGGVADYLPNNVIKGMLTAIGIIIILKQIPHAVGFDHDAEGDFGFWERDGYNTLTSLWDAFTHYLHPGAVATALVSMGILLLWERPYFKKNIPFVPGALVAVLVSVLLNVVFTGMGDPWAIRSEHLVQIPIAASPGELAGLFTLPDFSQWTNPEIYIVALTICAVASVETLLCIEAVDKIDPHKRSSNPNRELIAQGIGNTISGLIGGLPITSVIVRSSANIDAGAQTKMAAILHGLLILVCALLIPGLLNMIPLAALAAILILVGYKLAKVSIFKKMWSDGPYQWWPFIITVVAVVFSDLLTGVGIGLAASIYAILRHNLTNSYRYQNNYQTGDLISIKLAEEVSFLNKAAIKQSLDALPPNSRVVIDARDTVYIDHDVVEILREFQEVQAPERGIQLQMLGFKDHYNLSESAHVHMEHG